MSSSVGNSRWPLFGLLCVQLLTGILLMPMNNFFGIFLNEKLGLSVGNVARVIAMGQVVGMLASIVGGGVSDRWGKRRVLTIGLFALTICCALFLIRAPWAVLVLWGVGGAGLGLSVLSSQGYLTHAAEPGTLGVFSALYNWGYTIGGAIGVPIAALILGVDNFTALGYALVGLGFFTVLFTFTLPEVTTVLPQTDSVAGPRGYLGTLNRRVVLLVLLRFLPTCYYGVLTLLPLLIKRQGGSNALVAWYAAGSAVLASVTQLVAGKLADWKGTRVPATGAFAVILMSIVGIITTAESVWGLYVFGALGVSAAWALSTLLPGMVRMAAGKTMHGRVFGMLHVLWTCAMILGTLLGGALLETHVRLPFIIVGILNLGALALTVPFFNAAVQKEVS